MRLPSVARLLAISALLVFLWNVPEVLVAIAFAIVATLAFNRARRIRSQPRKLP